ncbi:MAG: Hsp20/alpha crystallin family protein [Thermodesulfobacteriota bacterium]
MKALREVIEMLTLKKWDPFTELSTIHKEMDEFFKRTVGSIAPVLFKGEWYPAFESYIKGEELVVHADLPGIDPKDVDISISGDKLTIKGERKAEKEETTGEYLFRETSYGSFERSMTLPEGVNVDKVHASYNHGVLEITMPAEAAALPKKVTVEVEEEKKRGRKAA